MDDIPEFAHRLDKLLTQNGRSPLWLAQQLGVDETAVQAWLDGQRVPENPNTIAQIEQLLNTAHRQKDEEESYGSVADTDNRSKGVYVDKNARIEGDVVGGDQNKSDFHGPIYGPINTGPGSINIQQDGHPSSIAILGEKLASALGWSEAPSETRQHKGKLSSWSVNYVYRAHPWFWSLTLTAVILLPLLWVFWVRPTLVTGLNVRGTAMIEAGEFTQAIQTLERAVRLYPNDARTHYNLGNAYDLFSENKTRARAEFNTTITLNDRFWPAYNNLARLQILTETPEDVFDTLRAGLRLKSEIPALEMAIFQKNMGWAYLDEAGRQKCPFPTIATVLAPQQTTVESALTYLKDAQTQMQTSREAGENVSIYLAEVYLLQGCAYEALGQPEKAHSAWSDSLALASAVLGSKQCTAPGSFLFDCLRADEWTDDVADRLGE